MHSQSDPHIPSGLDRHNRAKRARIESTNSFVADVQTELRHLQRGIASSSKHVEGFSGRVVSEASRTVVIFGALFLIVADLFQSTGLSDTIEKHSNTTTSKLTSLHQTTRSLLEQGAREDIPTGMTPKKHVWNYAEQWELTESRDVILQSRRREEPKRHTSEPPPSQPPQSPAEIFSEVEMCSLSNPNEYPDEPQTPLQPSPPTVLLSSSTSSTATLTADPVAPLIVPSFLKKPATLKSGLPTMGALVDRPPNTLRPPGTRRIR